jgi:hypothetical protein
MVNTFVGTISEIHVLVGHVFANNRSVFVFHCIDGLVLVEVSVPEKREGPGDKNQIRKSARAVMVQTMFHRPSCARDHDVLVVGGPIQKRSCYHFVVLMSLRLHTARGTCLLPGCLVYWLYKALCFWEVREEEVSKALHRCQIRHSFSPSP